MLSFSLSLALRLASLSLLLLLSGCAGVKSVSVSTSDYMAQRRGDILTTGQLSPASHAALQVLGLDAASCRKHLTPCHQQLTASNGLDAEQRTATLSELWLQQAIRGLHADDRPHSEEDSLHAWLQAARYAYAYLFFTIR